jgi:hypothetical protein
MSESKFIERTNAEGGIEYVNVNYDTITAAAEAEILTPLTITAEETAALYKMHRSNDYPSLQEQADMQYWDAINGTTTWQDAIAAIKAAHPKPE